MTIQSQGATAPAVFNFQSNTVRAVAKDGEIWFVASDVCAALAIKNHRDALLHLEADEKGVVSSDTLGGKQQVSAVNESGLYALVLRSRKAEARKFTKWVTSEVLPSIRKTGQYRTPYAILPGQTLTSEQADGLRNAMTEAAGMLPYAQRGGFMRTGWSKLKAHFGVSYRQIPQSELTEAHSIISRHAAGANHALLLSPPANKHFLDVATVCEAVQIIEHEFMTKIYPMLSAVQSPLSHVFSGTFATARNAALYTQMNFSSEIAAAKEHFN